MLSWRSPKMGCGQVGSAEEPFVQQGNPFLASHTVVCHGNTTSSARVQEKTEWLKLEFLLSVRGYTHHLNIQQCRE